MTTGPVGDEQPFRYADTFCSQPTYQCAICGGEDAFPVSEAVVDASLIITPITPSVSPGSHNFVFAEGIEDVTMRIAEAEVVTP